MKSLMSVSKPGTAFLPLGFGGQLRMLEGEARAWCASIPSAFGRETESPPTSAAPPLLHILLPGGSADVSTYFPPPPVRQPSSTKTWLRRSDVFPGRSRSSHCCFASRRLPVMPVETGTAGSPNSNAAPIPNVAVSRREDGIRRVPATAEPQQI